MYKLIKHIKQFNLPGTASNLNSHETKLKEWITSKELTNIFNIELIGNIHQTVESKINISLIFRCSLLIKQQSFIKNNQYYWKPIISMEI